MNSRDPGLQRERTQLAWGRSALGLTTITLLLIKLDALPALQLASVILLVRILLGAVAARKDELAGSDFTFGWRVVMRHLSLSLSVVLAAVWLLLY